MGGGEGQATSSWGLPELVSRVSERSELTNRARKLSGRFASDSRSKVPASTSRCASLSYSPAVPSHHTTSTGWDVDEKTLLELYLIWFHTGALDMIREVDEGLHMILQEVMEERLEDAGIEV